MKKIILYPITVSLFLLLKVLFQDTATAQIVIYPNSLGETQSQDYQVSVNNQPIFCYTSYAFSEFSTQKIMGRPVTPLTFASFDFQGTVTVSITFGSSLTSAGIDISKVTIRPLSLNIKPTFIFGNTISFQLSEACQLSIETGNQTTRVLHLFANPLELNPPLSTSTNVKVLNPGTHNAADVTLSGNQTVLYFTPGVHQVPSISPKSGELIYIAGGAVVELTPVSGATYNENLSGYTFAEVNPLINASWVNNVTIRGRGVLSGRLALNNLQRCNLIREQGCSNFNIEGVTVRESGNWSINLVNSSVAVVNNVKVIGHFVNSDGFVVGGVSNATVRNSFCHNADDAFEIKSWISMQNVIFDNCVSWSDVGCCFSLAWEINANVSNVWFQNCTVIHSFAKSTAQPAIGICSSFAPGLISNIHFKNIVIENDESGHAPIKVINNWQTNSWTYDSALCTSDNPYVLKNSPSDTGIGSITNVSFDNIQVINSINPDIAIISAGTNAPINDISFNNVRINGVNVTNSYPHLYTNQWVSGLAFSNLTSIPSIKQNNLKIYKKPTSSNIVMEYTLIANAVVNVDFIDLDGRLIHSFKQNSVTGFNQIELNLETLPSSIYLMKVSSIELNKTLKICI